jgi:uncharacterized protein YlxW (UPF0749 family)
VVGTLFVVSANNSEGTDLRPGRYTDLASFARVDAAHYDTLKSRVAQLNSQVAVLSSSVNNKQVRRYQREASLSKDAAGLLPVVGGGVTVTLSDSPLSHGPDTPENISPLLVHQQDIQAVVNAMWKAGAEAVTIAGQRVVSTTGIRCVGNSVQLQGEPYGQPYVISAIGDTAQLESTINKDSYLQIYRSDSANPKIAVGWNFQIEPQLTAPPYDGLLNMSYAKELPASAATN